jgi:hypothetical protein
MKGWMTVLAASVIGKLGSARTIPIFPGPGASPIRGFECTPEISELDRRIKRDIISHY